MGRLAARRLEVTCTNGAPTPPGVWGGGMFCDGTSLVPNKPRIGVV